MKSNRHKPLIMRGGLAVGPLGNAPGSRITFLRGEASNPALNWER